MAFHDTINTGTTPNDGQGDGLRTNIRKLYDNTKDNKQRLDDLNGNTPGVISSNGLTVLNPLDANFSHSGTTGNIGAIKIALPNSWGRTMMRFSVNIFDLLNNESLTLLISGYTYIDTSSWNTTSVQIITSLSSNNFTVRFGHDGTKCCIYIGELNSSWSYPKVTVTNFLAGHSNYAPSQWLTGWNIGFETSSFQNITATHTNNLPLAQ